MAGETKKFVTMIHDIYDVYDHSGGAWGVLVAHLIDQIYIPQREREG